MVRSKFMAVVLGLGLAGAMAVPTFAQNAGGNPPANQGGGGGGGNRGPRMSPEERHAAMQTRIKEAMGATDAEWAVLGPKVDKLMTLSMATRGMGFPGGRGRGGPGGGPGGGQQPNGPSSPVGDAAHELQTLLDNKDATVEQIKVKLATLRDAKAKAKEELTKTQTDIRELLTPRQEAVLVSMGMLD